MNNFIRRAGDP